MKKLIMAFVAVVMGASTAFAATPDWGNATINKVESGDGSFYSELTQQPINYTYVNASYDYQDVEETVVYGILTLHGPNTADYDINGLRQIAFEGIESASIPLDTAGQIHQEEVSDSGLYTIAWVQTTHMDFQTIITHDSTVHTSNGVKYLPGPTVYDYGESLYEGGMENHVFRTNLTTADGVVHQCEYKGDRLTGTVNVPETGFSSTKDGYTQLKCDNVTIYNDRGEDYWIDDNIPSHPILNTQVPDPVETPAEYNQYLDTLYNLCTSNITGSETFCNLYDDLIAANGNN